MPPLAIAAGVAAVGTIGGAIISSGAQKSAANSAAAAQQQATAQQMQLGREQMALNTNIYNSNYATLSPWVSRGNVAANNYNALLGLPNAPTMTSPLAGQGGAPGTGGNTLYNGPSLQQIQAMQHDGIPGNYAAAMQVYNSQPHPATNQVTGQTPVNSIAVGEPNPSATSVNGGPRLTGMGTGAGLNAFQGDLVRPPQDVAARTSGTGLTHGPLGGLVGAVLGHQGTPAAGGTPAPATAPPPAAGGTPASSAGPSAMDAFNQFANSAGMQFQMQQGSNALNNLYAGHGSLQSGAAAKALQNYGQQTALNNYFMPYMSMLNGQSAMGAQAGSAIAGVGSQFGNTAANIANGMSNAIGNGADATSNAALLRGQATGQMWNSIGGALGGLASSFVPTGARGF